MHLETHFQNVENKTLSFCTYCVMLFENIDKLQKYDVNLQKNNWEVMIALMIFFLL